MWINASLWPGYMWNHVVAEFHGAKMLWTNSNILSSEMQSHDSIITAVITVACDTSLREHAEQSVCLGLSPHSQVYIIDSANKLKSNLLTSKG